MSELAPRWQSPPPIYETSVTQPTTLKPYLTLPYLLSLTWLAYPILSILFVAFRLQLSLKSAEDAISDARNNLLNSCAAAERAATGAASLPRFMAIGTNKQIVDAVNGTLNSAREALILSLTVMEAIINFIVDIYRSTFLCFLELVIRGGLAILIGAVQELQQFVQNTLGGIRTSIQNDVASANSAISSTVNGINKVLPFNAHINVPQFSIPSLESLNNVTLPTDFEDALVKLNASIPSLDDLRQKITSIIDTPFELVKKDINDTFLGISFNESIMPVPELNALSFCKDFDTGVVDDLGVDLIKVARIGTILLIALALLLLAGHCLVEWYKWRCLQRSLENTRLAWSTDPTIYHVTAHSAMPRLDMTDENLLVLHATASHPLLSRLANKISSLLHLTPSQHTHLRFFLHYIFHPPALACFLIGFFGLLSVELQLLALGPVQARFSSRVAASVADFGSSIRDSINTSMQNQSSFYANSVNDRVSTMQDKINDGLLGWVNGTTTTLNETLVTFYTDIQNTVQTVFGGTILDQVAQEFVRCIIGSKVEAFENALTFLHDHLRVDLPTVNQSVLVISQNQVDEVTQPISLAAVGSGQNNDESLVGRLVNRYVSSLKHERVMFGIFILLWLVVVLMGLCIVFWHSYGKQWIDKRKRARWQLAQRGGTDAAITPWSHPKTLSDHPPDLSANEKGGTLHSFAPPMVPQEKTGLFAALRKAASDADLPREGNHIDPFRPSSERLVPARKSTKLVAMGRGAMGREVLLRDENAHSQTRSSHHDKPEVFEVEVREEKGASWWKRLWKRRGSDESFETNEVNKRDIERRMAFPNLTIETNIVLPQSQRDRFPIIVQNEDSPTPEQPRSQPEMTMSAWSMSPEVTRPMPWTRPLPANTLPSRPKPRSKVNLPLSVESKYGPSELTLSSVAHSDPTRTSPVANVPIHHGFIRPIPLDTPTSPSPTSPTVPNKDTALAPATDGARSSRTIATNHERPSSNIPADNPFATCFDDEHRAPTSPMKHLSTTNPFEGTPRAV